MKLILERNDFRDHHELAILGNELELWSKAILSAMNSIGVELKKFNDRAESEGLDEGIREKVEELSSLLKSTPTREGGA